MVREQDTETAVKHVKGLLDDSATLAMFEGTLMPDWERMIEVNDGIAGDLKRPLMIRHDAEQRALFTRGRLQDVRRVLNRVVD
jgi:hypothetical protein